MILPEATIILNLITWYPIFAHDDIKTPKPLTFYHDPVPTKTERNPRFRVLFGDQALTHRNWIQLDKRSYKIYNDTLHYEDALQRCINHHPDSRLAVVTSYKDSQILGKYLLAATPRLPNAWIGAKWYNQGYQFEPEPIMLRNISDSTGYPPWKYNRIQKSEACVLLDRHLSNITVFLEAKCIRLRPYICYIKNNTGFTDFIRGSHGYRLHYSRRNWIDAKKYCRNVYKNYSAHLVEIKDTIQLYDVLTIMNQKDSVERVWLGGIFRKSSPSPKWLWDSDKEAMPIQYKTRLRWVHSKLYESRRESEDSCAAMENTEKTYGMACQFELSYVCQFSAKSLRKLQDDENKNQEPGYCKRPPKFGDKYDPNLNQDFWRQHSECTEETSPSKPSLFSNWIQAGENLYKIFDKPVSFNTAKQKCLSQHPDVHLAIIPTLNHAQFLKGNLLTKTPNLKAVWVGGIWLDEPENKIQTINCVALDQHASDNPVFIKSRCKHKRPYVCHTKNGTGFTDLIIGRHGFRFHHDKKSWNEARDYCKGAYPIKSAHLMEMEEEIIGYHLNEVMEKFGVGHVWLGGKLYKIGAQPSWFWDNTCLKSGMGNWDNKTRYLSHMNDDCMVMDVLGKKFGAACGYELNYVCQFSSGELRILQRKEKSPKT